MFMSVWNHPRSECLDGRMVALNFFRSYVQNLPELT